MTSAGGGNPGGRDDVGGDAGGQVPDAAEWVGNTTAFLRVVDDAAARVYGLVTSELESGWRRATNELAGAVTVLLIVVALSPVVFVLIYRCLLYTSPSPRDRQKSRMPSSA